MLLDLIYCGDERAAKERVAELIRDVGLKPGRFGEAEDGALL